jgi:hypothetical protein
MHRQPSAEESSCVGTCSEGQVTFIGHTAERVIDEVACDVVIVKARTFKTQVEQVTHPLMRLPHVVAIHP